MSIKVTDLKKGTIFKENGTVYQVVSYKHVKTARGSANVVVKARDVRKGSVLSKTYISNNSVEDADVSSTNVQFLYKEGQDFLFMNISDYSQTSVSSDVVGDSAKFLKEGGTANLFQVEGEIVSVELPLKVILEVTYTEPGFKGDSSGSTLKPATLETGLEVGVPLFTNIGDKVVVSTERCEYVGRGK